MPSPGIRPPVDRTLRRWFSTDSGLRTSVVGFLLAASTFALYFPLHTHPFFEVDDRLYLVDNFRLHSGLTWPTLWWAFRSVHMANWIPLTWISFAIDYQLFGASPAGHHLVNVGLHALNVVLLFLVFKRATGYLGRSFMVAALFAVHPMNVEPVAWIAELKTMLSMVFFLLVLEAYRWYACRPGVWRYLPVVLLFGAGLAAKSQIITLPFVLLLWDYWPLQRMFPDSRSGAGPPARYAHGTLWSLVREKLPLLLLCAADAYLTILSQESVRSAYQPPLSWRLSNAVFSYWLYIRKAIWPSDLVPEYPQLGRYLSAWQVVAAALLLLGITALVVKARRHRYLPVGWFWFLGTLVPMIGLVQAAQQGMADRFSYQALLGLFIIACWGLPDLADHYRVPKAWLAGCSALVLFALAAVTARQITYWQSDFSIWTRASRVVKHHWIAEDNLGAFLERQGRKEEALVHFSRAAEMNPTDSGSNLALASYDQQHGQLQDAILHYQRALEDYDYNLTRETKIKALVNMAVAYRDLGDEVRAHLCLEQARQLQAR